MSHGFLTVARPCPKCRGEGVLRTPCQHCRGEARQRAEHNLAIKIPAGIDDGQQVRLRGRGHAGTGGGPPGDLYTVARIAEDDRFFEHRGVDWDELSRAVRARMLRGRSRGASTISQQVARNLFLSPSRSFGRKLSELLIARHLDRELGKERILEIYLNIAEWGEGIFGAEAASRAYYGKPASELSPEEAVALAVALPSPYRLNPARAPTPLTLKKRELYLERMRRSGFLDSEGVPSLEGGEALPEDAEQGLETDEEEEP